MRIKTASDRLQFAVYFATMSLDDARPGDLQNLREELSDFLMGRAPEGSSLTHLGGIMATPLVSPFPSDYAINDFQTLQTDTRRILEELVDNRTGAGSSTKTTPVAVRKSLVVFGSGAILSVTGPTRDVFLEQLFHLLSREPSDRIRRCPECGRLFFRVRRQLNCGRACTLAISNRRYAAGAKGQAAKKRRYEANGWSIRGRQAKATRLQKIANSARKGRKR